MGYINVTLDTQKITGKTNKQISIYSNDPRALETSVLLRAEVVGSALLIPFDRLKLTNVGQRQDRKRRLLIRKDPTETGELRVTDLKASVSWIATSLLPIETEMSLGRGFPPGKPGDYLLEIDFVNQPPNGVSKAEVTFKTGLPRFPQMTVPVNVEYAAPVIMNRKEIVLPAGTTDVYRDSVLLTVRRGLDPSTLNIDSEIDQLQTALEQVGERHFKLFLTWNGDAFEAGALKASVGGYHAELPVRVGQ